VADTHNITVRRLHWYAAAPWRALFRFRFSDSPGRASEVTVVALTPGEARERAAHLRAAMITMRDKGEL
jgi:hypothetical protein